MIERVKEIIKGMSAEDVLELLEPHMKMNGLRDLVIQHEFSKLIQEPDMSRREAMLIISAKYDRVRSGSYDTSGMSMRHVRGIVSHIGTN